MKTSEKQFDELPSLERRKLRPLFLEELHSFQTWTCCALYWDEENVVYIDNSAFSTVQEQMKYCFVHSSSSGCDDMLSNVFVDRL